MQKKFFAFVAGTNHNSGITTCDKALEWAKTWFGKSPATTHVYVAEVMDVVERTNPPIKVSPYRPIDEEAAKVAALT